MSRLIYIRRKSYPEAAQLLTDLVLYVNLSRSAACLPLCTKNPTIINTFAPDSDQHKEKRNEYKIPIHRVSPPQCQKERERERERKKDTESLGRFYPWR